jgi:acetyl-CoA C-acetyltransferase/potassium large conductance calcium-activated channel subfamily M alpha protein 1
VLSLFDDLQQSNIWQIATPDEFVNKTFSELYLYMLNKYGIVTIGLYRLQGAKGNSCPYVYTKPKPFIRLTSRDKLFILNYKIPPEMSI